MNKQITVKCECGHTHTWWHDCPIPAEVVAVRQAAVEEDRR